MIDLSEDATAVFVVLPRLLVKSARAARVIQLSGKAALAGQHAIGGLRLGQGTGELATGADGGLVHVADGVLRLALGYRGVKAYRDAMRGVADAERAVVKLVGSCFAAGTPILVPGGSRPVEAIAPGDAVLSRDESRPDGEVVARVVEAVFERSAEVLELRARGRVVRTTSEHPFWVAGRGWVSAGELRPGDVLVSHDGQEVPVEGVAATGERQTVYNFRVADTHTYFVGCDEWGFSVWAHNTACGESVRLALEAEGILVAKGDPRLDAIAKQINDGQLGSARRAIRDLPGGDQKTGKTLANILDAAENPPVRGNPALPPVGNDPVLPTAPPRRAPNPNWMKEQGWEPIAGQAGHFRRDDGARLDTNTAGEVGKLPHYDMTLPDGRRIKVDPANGEAPGNAAFLNPEHRSPEGGGAMDGKQQRRKGYEDRK